MPLHSTWALSNSIQCMKLYGIQYVVIGTMQDARAWISWHSMQSQHRYPLYQLTLFSKVEVTDNLGQITNITHFIFLLLQQELLKECRLQESLQAILEAMLRLCINIFQYVCHLESIICRSSCLWKTLISHGFLFTCQTHYLHSSSNKWLCGCTCDHKHSRILKTPFCCWG